MSSFLSLDVWQFEGLRRVGGRCDDNVVEEGVGFENGDVVADLTRIG